MNGKQKNSKPAACGETGHGGSMPHARKYPPLSCFLHIMTIALYIVFTKCTSLSKHRNKKA